SVISASSSSSTRTDSDGSSPRICSVRRCTTVTGSPPVTGGSPAGPVHASSSGSSAASAASPPSCSRTGAVPGSADGEADGGACPPGGAGGAVGPAGPQAVSSAATAASTAVSAGVTGPGRCPAMTPPGSTVAVPADVTGRGAAACARYWTDGADQGGDRKSTRLNSSHVKISYAVFCLKK